MISEAGWKRREFDGLPQDPSQLATGSPWVTLGPPGSSWPPGHHGPWVTLGPPGPRVTPGSSWVLLAPHGPPGSVWALLAPPGFPWAKGKAKESATRPGTLKSPWWTRLTFLGSLLALPLAFPWIRLAPPGFPWLPLAPPGSPWLLLAPLTP